MCSRGESLAMIGLGAGASITVLQCRMAHGENIMLRLNVVFVALLVTIGSARVFAEPIVLFSDLNSGPNTGWSQTASDKGVVVTIYGKGFGSSRGSSYVTVNGVNLTSDSDYPDGWGQTNDPIPWLQRITFQLNSTMPSGQGEISVTVGGQTSNSVPFLIRPGNIYFADPSATGGDGSFENPWGNPGDFFRGEAPGDTLYLRGGLYNGKYLSGKQNFYLGGQSPGTADRPIAIVGYPGETATLDTEVSGDDNFRGAISGTPSYYTFARLDIDARTEAINSGPYSRIVGNDLEGGKVYTAGTGVLMAIGSGVKLLGNRVYGTETGTKQDHGVYVQGCPDEVGSEVAYNYVYDHSVDRGPVVVVNHQQNRCPSTAFVKSHYIHSNVVDCSDHRARGIAVYDLSWDGPPETEPEPTIIYNNIVNSCGREVYPAMYTNAAHTEWYNNTVYNAVGVGLEIMNPRVISTKVKNNIFHMAESSARYVNHVDGTLDISHNLYFGGDSRTALGEAAIEADPMVTIDTQNWLFSIDENSPAKDAGTTIALPQQLRDFNGLIYTGPKDIGAIEFSDGAPVEVPDPEPEPVPVPVAPPAAPTPSATVVP